MSSVTQSVAFRDPMTVFLARLRVVSLVVGFALLAALAAQIRVPLGFTPVPVTLQTAVALFAGAALGARVAGASMGLYVLAGLVFPFYAGGESGWTYVMGATGGYLLGMILAALAVGVLAERAKDHGIVSALPVMILGSALIYALGVPWLAASTGMSVADAFAKGALPFLAGDLAKSVAVGLAMPTIWYLRSKQS